MKVFVIFLIASILIFKYVESATFQCVFDQKSNYLECEAKDYIIPELREVTEVYGEEKYKRNAISLVLKEKALKSFSQGLIRWLPNLVKVEISGSSLVEIQNTDLLEFGSFLKTLLLPNNQIEVLHEDLFKYNSNLEEVSLEGNKIRHIHGTLKGVNSLRVLNLKRNACVDREAKNKVEIKGLIDFIERHCNNPTTTTQAPTTTGKQDSAPLNAQKSKDEEEMSGGMLALWIIIGIAGTILLIALIIALIKFNK